MRPLEHYLSYLVPALLCAYYMKHAVRTWFEYVFWQMRSFHKCQSSHKAKMYLNESYVRISLAIHRC